MQQFSLGLRKKSWSEWPKAAGGGWGGRKAIYKYLWDSASLRKDCLGGARSGVQTGPGRERCQENPVVERSGMRAGPQSWLSPNFDSVDVIKMMVEGEREKRGESGGPGARGLLAQPRATPPGLDYPELHKGETLLRIHSRPRLLLSC